MTARKSLRTHEANTLEQWRQWLANHHDSESEIWLVFFKPHSGRTGVKYADALDEALCFGWIDSLVRRLDDDRYARKFTPRKPDSKWSSTNRKRYAELQASGRMMPVGLNRPPTDRSGDAPRPSPSKLPAYIAEALKRQPQAQKYFESLAPSFRRLYIAWIDSAKREETRVRRLEEAVGLLASGKKLGLK